MQFLVLLTAFISAVSALALPGLGSSFSNWLENSAIRSADKKLTAGLKNFNRLATGEIPASQAAKVTAKTQAQVQKADEIMKSVAKFHNTRQELMQLKIDSARRAGNVEKANALQLRKDRKAKEVAHQMNSLALKHGQSFVGTLNNLAKP